MSDVDGGQGATPARPSPDLAKPRRAMAGDSTAHLDLPSPTPPDQTSQDRLDHTLTLNEQCLVRGLADGLIHGGSAKLALGGIIETVRGSHV